MSDPWPVLTPPRSGHFVKGRASPAFSVVIAAYQAEQTIADSIDSVLAQTHPPSEIIVCDDGSTDATAEIVRSYGSAVRLIRQANGGESAAKNSAVRSANGEFVAVLDADDVFAPRWLEAVAWLGQARTDLDVLLTDAHRVVDGIVMGEAYHGGWPFEHAEQRSEILVRNFVLGLAAVRRERWLAIGGFDESVRLTADWDFFIRLLRSGSLVGLVDVPLAEYRLRPGSLSSNHLAMVASRIRTMEAARARGGLEAHELRRLDATLAAQRRELLVARAKAALVGDVEGSRRSCLAIARNRGFRRSRRAAALAAAAFPWLAGFWLRARHRGTVEVATGLRAPAAE